MQPRFASACDTNCDTDDWLHRSRSAAADMLPLAATASTASKLAIDKLAG